MKILSLFLVLIFSFSLFAQPSEAKIDEINEENPVQYQYIDDYSHIIEWDSLSYFGFSKLYQTTFSDYYNFPSDSTPEYSDSVLFERIEALNKKSPFSFRYNESVRAMINLYTYRSGIISRALSKKDLYFPLYEEMLDKYSVPQELKYLSIIESALNPKAKSHAHAVGLWQFIKGTGRMYGLHSSYSVDDRMNPYKATEAACQHFIDLYDRYGDWNLVLAAYNAGPGNVNRAIERSGSTDYWELRKYLPRETQAYVPAFIAVNYLMNYADAHNIQPKYDYYKYYETDTVVVYDKITFNELSDWLQIDKEMISDLNPQYKRNYIPAGESGNILCLPVDLIGEFILNKKLILSGISREEYEQQQASSSDY